MKIINGWPGDVATHDEEVEKNMDESVVVDVDVGVDDEFKDDQAKFQLLRDIRVPKYV